MNGEGGRNFVLGVDFGTDSVRAAVVEAATRASLAPGSHVESLSKIGNVAEVGR
jgi:ribulose kinase